MKYELVELVVQLSL